MSIVSDPMSVGLYQLDECKGVIWWPSVFSAMFALGASGDRALISWLYSAIEKLSGA